jgi:hypothetical protein
MRAARRKNVMNASSTATGAALVLLGMFGPAWSHEVTLWPALNDKAVRLTMYLGDPGDYQPIDRIRFVELTVFDSKGTKISFLRDIESGVDNKSLTTPKLRLGDWPGGTYVAVSRYDNGFYIHDSENRAVATTKEWLPDAIDSAHYMKFSKALFHIGASSEGYDRTKAPEVRTDDRGIILVKLDHRGFYRLAVEHRAPSKYPDLYAYDDYTASLVFAR